MDKEKFIKLLKNAKVDKYGNLYILEKEIEKPIFEDIGEKKWYR